MLTADTRDYALEISEPLFRLTTEGVRLRSNQTRSHESLTSLTLHLASADHSMASHDADVLLQHLEIIPTNGDIDVRLVLPASCADRLGALGSSFEKLVARPLTTGDTLSLLLFDFAVERKAACVLDALGLDSSGGPEFVGRDDLSSH